MPILTKSKSWRPLVQAVREVRLGVPFEREELVRFFYHGLLGLRERETVPKIPGGWVLGDSRARIHFHHRHSPTGDPLRRRLAITVPSLRQLEQRLSDVGWI